jgi:hypothetical protein
MKLNNSEWDFYIKLGSSWYLIPTILMRYKKKHFWDFEHATPAFIMEILWLKLVIGFQVQEKL